MSIHGCNDLCNLDRRFHDIQRNEGDFSCETADKEEMREYLTKRIGELAELLAKLNYPTP